MKETVLAIVTMIDRNIIEYEKALNELDKIVPIISTKANVHIDFMVVDKIPTFFDAVHEDFGVKYCYVVNEIADYALWRITKRKQQYREFGISYLRPIIIFISDFVCQDEFDFLKSPEWIKQIKNRSIDFIPCCLDEKSLKAERISYQFDIEVLRAERIIECIRNNDIDIEEKRSSGTLAACTIEISI